MTTPSGAFAVAPWRRWLRRVAIAGAVVSLASCRAIPPAAVVGTAAVSQAIDQLDAAGSASESDTRSAAEPPPGARISIAPPIESTVEADWQAEVRQAAHSAAGRTHHEVRTGLESPCPPLPRFHSADGPCGECGPAACDPTPCVTCRPFEPLPPIVAPCLVCDGGDGDAPALPDGASGLRHLTAGDTVARFRPADQMPDAEHVRIVASNCACVFAPRFGAVREVTRPIQDAQPEGPRGLTLPAGPELEFRGESVCRKTQTVALESARRALPGVAIEDRLGPLAVDQGEGPSESDGLLEPQERVRDERLELARGRQRPLVQVGFDVPIAWTCIKAANVLLDERSAQVVAADRGTATLRFESPGRAELTLCKRAGTDTARQGEELDFTIYMHNSGDRPLTGIVLADALPSRLEYVPDSAAASVAADFSRETGDDGSTVLTWRVRESLRPGAGGFVRFRTLVK